MNKAMLTTLTASVLSNKAFPKHCLLPKDARLYALHAVSVDTKKKGKIGNLFREGVLYTIETIEIRDHDFPSLAEGVAIPTRFMI